MKPRVKLLAALIMSMGTAYAQTIVYNTDTVNRTLADGSKVVETYQLTYTDGKMTSRTLISTKVLSGPTTSTTSNTTASPTTLYYGSTAVGTPTQMASSNPTTYLTTEANNAVRATNAAVSISRGWTGAGRTILIMDSGIDLKNSEFAGKIKYTIDYTRTSMQDTNGHGTHVAGIAAARLDGKGTYGIAPDANLAIAKIGTNANVNMGAAQAALVWAQQYSDIVVANLSSNVVYNTIYTSSIYKLADGTYASNHYAYGGKNYYNLERPDGWANSLGKNMVLVVAAGNQNLPYVSNPATFATAVDAQGNLVLKGQMIIAGNWNSTTNQISGQTAGHVCKDIVSNVCRDTYRTSDFFLMAPGTAIVSTSLNGTYKSMSGTSMAAPAISGAVAVVNQLWPYMPGDQIAQLLFKTANKNLPGYNKEVHGQGLLDLDRATQPIGNLGITTTGRTGTVTPISGSISVAGLSGSATGKLASVSVVDEFRRDYQVNLTPMVNSRMLQPTPYMAHSVGQSWSSKYAGWTTTHAGVTVAGGNSGNTSLSIDSRALSPRYESLRHQFTVTQTAYNPWVNFSGMWGTSRDALTLEYSTVYAPSTHGFWAQGGVMQTTGRYDYGMVNRVTPIYSAYAMVGHQSDGMNVYAGIKPVAFAGSVSMTVPTSVDADGVMQYQNVTGQVRNAAVGYVGTSYRVQWKSNTLSLTANAGQDGSYSGGVQYLKRF